MQNYFINYVPDDEELKLLEKQKTCPHDKWHIRCSVCRKILGSEKHQPLKIAQINSNFDCTYRNPENNIFSLYKGEQTPIIASKGYGILLIYGECSIVVVDERKKGNKCFSGEMQGRKFYEIEPDVDFVVKATEDAKFILLKL